MPGLQDPEMLSQQKPNSVAYLIHFISHHLGLCDIKAAIFVKVQD